MSCRPSLGHAGRPRLNFGVTVRAEQHALAGFRAGGIECSRDPSARQPKLLERRVEVVELKRALVARIAAQRAAPACLLDERALHVLAPAMHGFRTAPGAPRAAALERKEVRLAVAATGRDEPAATCRQCGQRQLLCARANGLCAIHVGAASSSRWTRSVPAPWRSHGSSTRSGSALGGAPRRRHHAARSGRDHSRPARAS